MSIVLYLGLFLTCGISAVHQGVTEQDALKMNVNHPIPALSPCDDSAQSSICILGQG